MRTRWWLLLLFVAMGVSAVFTFVLCFGYVIIGVNSSAHRDRRIEESEQRRVAAHEVGHAIVAAYLLGPDEVERITVYTRLQSDGLYGVTHTRDHNRLETADDILREAAVFMGGRASDKFVNGAPTNGAGSDLAHVNDIVWNMHLTSGLGDSLMVRTRSDAGKALEARVEEDVNGSNACAEAIVAANSETIVLLADLIMRVPVVGDERDLSGDSFRAFLRDHPVHAPPEAVLPALMFACHPAPH